MNEQIRELWRACVLKHTNNPMNWQTVADEFSELIVQKCVAIVALHGISNFENDDISWTCENIIDEIRAHFKVEE
jgi:hypothetical protein